MAENSLINSMSPKYKPIYTTVLLNKWELYLHAKPVPLCTLELVGELKAVHLQQVKEGVSYYIRYAVIRLHQTSVEPATRIILVKNISKKELCRVDFRLKLQLPTCCHSHSETWWRCSCWRHQNRSERTGWCLCTGRVHGNSCRCLQKLLQEMSGLEDY